MDKAFEPTDHELKVMRYLHQRGPTERRSILVDCSGEDSMIAARGRTMSDGIPRRRFYQGSNGAAPMIVARWMKRLIAEGLAKERRSSWTEGHYHEAYLLTQKGHQFVRAFHSAEGKE